MTETNSATVSCEVSAGFFFLVFFGGEIAAVGAE